MSDFQVEIKDDIPSGELLLVNTDNIIINYSHEDLLKALYWIWDAFDRANIHMFVVSDTHHSIRNNLYLEGDKVEVGTRKLEWDSGSYNVFKAFAGEPDFMDKGYYRYIYNNIPVIVHVYDDDLSITNLDTKMYFGENFNLPTPYSRFEKFLWR